MILSFAGKRKAPHVGVQLQKRAFRHHLLTFNFLKRKSSCSQIIGNHEELHSLCP
jgi:hypothetical protein